MSQIKGFLIAAGAAALISGCACIDAMRPDWMTVGPDYKAPETNDALADLEMPDAGAPTTNRIETGEYAAADTNDDVRAVIDAEQLANWWIKFNDPVLDQLMETSVSNSLSFLMARERLIQARWQLLGSAAPLYPSISLGGSATRGDHHRYNSSMYSSYKSTGRKFNHSDLFHGGFDATWEIDIFGGAKRAVEAAYASAEAAEFSMQNTWVSLTAEIASQYINLRTTQERIQVALRNLKLQGETYDILKSRFDSGIGDELAVNQAKYNVDQTHARLPQLYAQQEAYLNALAILVGTAPGSLHSQLAELPQRDWLVEPQRLDGSPLNAIRQRPDVKVAERRLAAQVASVGVAKANLLPRFYINGTLGLESVKIQKFMNKGDFYGTIGPSFSWPIFQGGNLIANLRIEESKMNEAYYNYELVMQTAFGEVRNAYSSYTQEYHRFQALQGAVKAATDAESIAQDLYKNGLRDFNNVLDAQRSLLSLEEEFVVAKGQITLDLIALYKALGGGLAL